MVNNNFPQITSVTSESLQAQIRNLLPSQQGFGTDLMAQNVIVPIVDLTAAAQGSTVPTDLQQALAFGSQTAFSANNSTVVIANTTGFYRIFGNASLRTSGGGAVSNVLQMSDGLSTKNIWSLNGSAGSTDLGLSDNFDFIVFLAASESISAISNSADAFCVGSSRQIATVNGDLVNPSGFTPQ